MVLGPVIGGLVTQFTSPQFAALVAAALSALCVFMVFLFVPPRTRKLSDANEVVDDDESLGSGSIQALTSLLRYPRIPFLLGIRVVTGIPLGVFQSMFSRVSIEIF